ncbi:tripartite tricarboxylate transporter substrate-binding protein [Plastoroseomonas hellenica]|uniref:tripartite tricarboxylate transporter substrate-binding protein n=1 Tax=Plastoroseomonas hellenica TaxID=2687306 RepID=UPI001BACD70B|nr:tripartite tricarboxylate transporter substrate-binding protein [Plastoroseomonas hellenica]MBR0641583.1 tripartite tricarboxylate transporter substrate binding protein [Plastoroseomonas hellenica]
MRRRTLLSGLAAAPLAAPAIRPALAQAWPERPLRVIVPFPPGGAIDAMIRLLAPDLGAALGQPLVVENRAGAGGTIGTEAAARSGDQHTLLMVSMAHAVNPALYPRLPYDGADLVAVAPVAVVPNLLVVPAASPIRDTAGLIAAARRTPGGITYASAGNGTSIHLAGALFAAMAGVDMTHVPYRGSGPAIADLLAGRVDCMFDSVTSAAPHVAGGRLRALAATTAERAEALPALPTVGEAGLPGYAVDPWFAMLAPRDLPAAARQRMEAAVLGALRDGGIREKLAGIGAQPMPGDAASLQGLIAAETRKWAEVVQRAGIRAD